MDFQTILPRDPIEIVVTVDYSMEAPDHSVGYSGALSFDVTDSDGNEVELTPDEREFIEEECAEDLRWEMADFGG